MVVAILNAITVRMIASWNGEETGISDEASQEGEALHGTPSCPRNLLMNPIPSSKSSPSNA